MASVASASNTPAASHSSRRSRTVVSETLLPHKRSASTHEQPVESRTSITMKQFRFDDRGRWQPRGWASTGRGTRGSMADQTAFNTSGSSARMMVQTFHLVVGVDSARHQSRYSPATGGWSPFHKSAGHRPIRLSARPLSAIPIYGGAFGVVLLVPHRPHYWPVIHLGTQYPDSIGRHSRKPAVTDQQRPPTSSHGHTR